MCGCADVKMCGRMCEFANVQMCGCADVRMCGGVYVRMCGCAGGCANLSRTCGMQMCVCERLKTLTAGNSWDRFGMGPKKIPRNAEDQKFIILKIMLKRSLFL
jgi:hypothetical protein